MGASSSVNVHHQRAKAMQGCAPVFEHDVLVSMWQQLDVNGNGIVPWSHVEAMVVQSWMPFFKGMVKGKSLTLAYERTFPSKDGWVEKRQFKTLLLNMWLFYTHIEGACEGTDKPISFFRILKTLLKSLEFRSHTRKQ